MQAKEVQIRFNKKTGNIEFETSGFVGESCDKFLDQICEELGLEKGSIEDKPERLQEVTETELEAEQQKLING